MKILTFSLVVIFAALSGCSSAAPSSPSSPSSAVDPLSGKWDGTWGPNSQRQTNVALELKWDGSRLTGTVNPEGRAITIENGSFNAGTSALTMELDSPGGNGAMDHYVIKGKVDGIKMSGTWIRGNGHGDFNLKRN